METKELRQRVKEQMKEQNMGEFAIALEMDVPVDFILNLLSKRDLKNYPEELKKAEDYLGFIYGSKYPTFLRPEEMSCLDLANIKKPIRDEIKKDEAEYIKKHDDFILCGVAVKDFGIDSITGLYVVRKGTCRINAHQIFIAMRSRAIKRELERNMIIGK